MPNNKVKTAKALQGKGGSKKNGGSLHPHSRRAKQLERVALRTQKLDVQAKKFKTRQGSIFDRYLQLIESVQLSEKFCSMSALHQIVQNYISRNESEMQQLRQEQEERSWRKTGAKSKRLVDLELVRDQDELEYSSGFVLPDLTDEANVRRCREWARIGDYENLPGRKGDPGFVSRITLVSIRRDDVDYKFVEQQGVASTLSKDGSQSMDTTA